MGSACCLLLSLSALLLLHSSSAIPDLTDSANLVQKVCNKTEDYKSCIQVLTSSPRTHGANLTALAHISLDLVKANATATAAYIHRLDKETKEPAMKMRFRDCRLLYGMSLVDVQRGTVALVAKDYYETSARAAAISAEVVACELAFKEKPVRKSPLTRQNKYVDLLSNVIVVISNMISV
ncbi:putative invertase inhibitor [Aristolochia californica]|uniref:putative invertase inhibitor n=1 Tax=Aristolochia californica TaxID=171875 RepID=UPI0035DAE239